MLVTDTNILVRCVIGKAFSHVLDLIARDIVLVTTDRNVDECLKVLSGKLGLETSAAYIATLRILRPFEIVGSAIYLPWRTVALDRLGAGGESDWPVLAASMALDCGIWSQDVDFFGTGVAIWSTRNVRFFHLRKEA